MSEGHVLAKYVAPLSALASHLKRSLCHIVSPLIQRSDYWHSAEETMF